MFKNFITALVQKFFIFLQKNPDFFNKSKTEKASLIEDFSVPQAFKNYLLETDAVKFLQDIQTIVKYTNQEKEKSIGKSEFFKALLEFLTTDLARKIDFLDSNYYILNESQRIIIVEKLIKGESTLAVTLREILIKFSYHQIAEKINSLGQIIAFTPYFVVQSPREIDSELKKEIREQLYADQPLTFPIFQINKKLIGGIRIFKNGTSQDFSWLARVLKFTSLTSV